jgi:O-antigen/teichoic acid export membrane protein
VKRDYALTFAAEFAVLLTGLLVYRFAATYWDPTSFGEYVLTRRTLAFIQAQTLLGLGVSLPRYIASVKPLGQSAAVASRYLLSGIALALVTILVIGLLFMSMPGPLATLFFGEASYRTLLAPLYVCVTGLTLHSLTYGYFRGHLRMVEANVLQVVNIGVAPLAVFAVPDQSVASVLSALGSTWVLIAGGTLGVLVMREVGLRHLAMQDLVGRARELAQYGIPRIPGDLALNALLTLPATLTAHWSGMEQAGHVAFSIAVLSMIGSLFSPIGLVLLPSASAAAARGQLVSLRNAVRKLVAVAGVLTLLGVALLEVIAPWLVSWDLGLEFRSAAGVVRLVGLGALPYVIYILLRAPIDALSVRAINARNLIVGLGAFGGLVLLIPSTAGIAVSLAIALSVIGVLSIRDASSLLRSASGGPRTVTAQEMP